MSFETTFERRDDATRAALGAWESEGGAGGRAMVFALWDTASHTVLGVWPSEDGALAAVRATRDRAGPGAAATWALVGDNPDGEAGVLARGGALADLAGTSRAVTPMFPVSLFPLAGD
ncbi:MAG: hypothetical protein QOF73_18 [Thermomicrobiales bacterium]|jgi:hypothetical protein|nr:hypothetical protein [Thermomicrobiales bacterium]